MYILLAILAFGILIAVHEFGHFIAAKLLGVKVNEFSIGMGPKILGKQGKETLYTWRLLPIGGFCAMEGEDEETDDPRAFTRQKAWKRLIILAAGATLNFVLGFVVVLGLTVFAGPDYYGGNELVATHQDFLYGGESGLMPGDEIIKIDGHRIYYSSDFRTYMSRAGDTVDMVIIRDGEKIELKNYALAPSNYTEPDGTTEYRYGLYFETIDKTVWQTLKYSTYETYNFVRLVWMGLTDLFSGNVGLKDLSGPVGIVDTINDVAQSSESTSVAVQNIIYLVAFISVNLGVMNLLPIPALDGGRIFFLIITWVVQKITRKKLNPKYEGYIHAAGMVLLLGLMAIVMVSDIVKIVK